MAGNDDGAGEPLPETTSAVEIAMSSAAGDPASRGQARRLLAVQTEVLELEKAHLRQQIGLARNERFRNRIKAVRDGALSLAVVALVAIGGWMLWDAVHASGTVIEPFATTPALAAAGLSGEAAANRLRDAIDAMSEAVERGSSTRRRSTTSGGAAALDVSIPDAGFSVGEVLRQVRRRFGSETVVTGEISPAPDGQVAVTARVDGVAVATALAPAADPAPAFAAVAEAVYARVEPYRHGAWLYNHGHFDEAERAYRALTYQGSRKERAWAWNGVTNALRVRGDMAGAAAAGRRSVELNPKLPNAWGALWEVEMRLGHTAGYDAAVERLAAIPLAVQIREGTDPERAPALSAFSKGQLALTHADLGAALADFRRAADLVTREGDSFRPRCMAAEALARLHRPAEAERLIDEVVAVSPPGSSSTHYCLRARLLARLDRGDFAGAVAVAAPPIDERNRGYVTTFERTQMAPLRALALAGAGRRDEAIALIGGGPLDCTPCVIARGRLAAQAGDTAGSERWFAEAVRQAPRSPYGWQAWGEARLARGDLTAALAAFRQARKLAPRWADPVKAVGDVLARQGHADAARREYDRARLLAPQWGALRR